MSRSGQEALPEVQELSGGSPGGLGVVGSCRAALSEVWKWSEVVGRPTWRSGSGREALAEVRE